MPGPPNLTELGPALAAIPGTVSVWWGLPGREPAYVREPDTTHYAASSMKVAVMAAAHRLADAGRLDLDAEVPVHAEFASAVHGRTYRSTADYDNDPEPWERLGGTAPLRWLVRRMIVRSSNLATNLVLERSGLRPVSEVWALAGARHSLVTRGIQDDPAADAELSNLVTARDLAGLLAAIRAGSVAGPTACQEMVDTLLAQEVTEDVVQGLPPDTRVAHKNGWVEGIRHSAALVLPEDSPAYVLVVCISAPLEKAVGCHVVARLAAASWADRGLLSSSS